MRHNLSRQIYLLKKILSDDWTLAELKEFFDFLKSLSLRYLRKCEKSNLKIANAYETLEDIADDFMIELFAHSERFHVWHRYVEQQGFPTEENANRFFWAIVKNKTRQGLSRVFYERAPIAFNVVRSLKLGYNGCVINKPNGRFLVHRKDTAKLIMPEHDFEKIYALYSQCASGSGGFINVIAERILESIEEQPVYARVINVALLAKAHEQNIVQSFTGQVSPEYRHNGKTISVRHDEKENDDDDMAIREFISRETDKYCNDYVNNRPYKQFDYWQYAPAVKDYFAAMIDGREDSIYEIVAQHFPELSSIQYQRNCGHHRTCVEYTIKVIRRKLRIFLYESSV